jgi:hypothetical protein
MTKPKVWVLSLFFFAVACQNSVPNDSAQLPPKGQPDRKNNFFPVADYLRSEIALVDSMPIGFARYRTRMGKSDTSFVATAIFDSLAKEFLPPELSDSVFEKDFQENSFMDQSTQAVTFTYSTKKDKAGLRRVDVLAKQGPEFDKIKSIYMEKTEIHQDTIIEKKMIWKAKQSMQIITITQPANRPPTTEQIKLVWDNVD